jgi:flavin reductase (DIM6/NTAB) family NADH-FMN oxidoreductase RutF
MMEKTTGEGIGAFYHHYPRVAVVVTAHSGDKDNAMAVAWHTPLSFDPPLYAVSVSPKRFTYRIVAESKEFGVNFLPSSEAEMVASVGGSKGSEVDKFTAFNISQDKPLKTSAPILNTAYAAYECRLVSDREYGDHRLLVGEIVAVHWHEAAFSADETLDMDKLNPLLYLGGERYITASECTIRTLERKIYGKNAQGYRSV